MTAAFTDNLDQLRSYADIASDEIHDEIIEAVNGTDITVGYQIIHGSYSYNIRGHPEADRFQLRFPYSIPHDLGSLLNKQDAREFVQDPDGDDRSDDIQVLAAFELLERMSEENREQFRFHLSKAIQCPDNSYSLRQTEAGAITGFDITCSIYLQDDSYSLNDYADDVTALVGTGHSGVVFVGQAFDLSSMLKNETGGDTDLRYVQ